MQQPCPAGTAPAATDHSAWLATHRPDLAGPYRAELPGAAAAILARLWGAIAREPLPGRTGTAEHAGHLTVTIGADPVTGPAAAAHPFAAAPVGLTIGGYRHPAELARLLWPDATGFAAELDGSVANLALARAAAAPADDGSLAAAEQSVVDGHPLHPCCRTRTGMDTADLLAYAPEHRATVALPVIAVPARRWYTTGAGLPPRLTVHPWQWRHLREAHPDLTDTGERIPGRPLLSLRTFATPYGHRKTAVDVRMTSAVRTVSPAALTNGPLLSARLADLTRDLPTLGVLAERAGGAVLVDGLPSRHLAVLHRDAPTLGPDEQVYPLAATARSAALVDTGYGGDPAAFLGHLATLLLPPLLRLLDRGVGLEAHGQNLLLVTAAGRARRLLYRDFGGLRVDPAVAGGTAGDVGCADPATLRTKVYASAVATVLAEHVAVLAARTGTAPERLWAAVAAAVPRGHDLTRRGTLPLKAMTAMRLADTVDDRWTTVPNPLAGR